MPESTTPTPRSLTWTTEIDVLPLDRLVERRGGHLVIRSPGNPAHFWGNLLLFDDPPRLSDGMAWEALFDDAFGDDPRVRHRTLAWDRVDGAVGAASAEFVARGYDLAQTIGLVAVREQLRTHPRANPDVVVRELDPADGADAELWDAVVELQVQGRDHGHEERSYRTFTRARLADRRALFREGRGAWYVALDPRSGAVVASCGIVVTGNRGRFQVVDTAPAFRRRGISSRLIVEAAHRSAEEHGTEQFVIVAELGYHALGLYESLGFERTEHVVGVCQWQRSGAVPSLVSR